MGKGSRDKGKRGEREVAEILRAEGFVAKRDGRLDVDLVHNVKSVHFEVKRREKLSLPTWHDQAAQDASHGEEPIVVYRRNGEPWRASVDFRWLANMLASQRGIGESA